jgi:hypothetical protein
MYGGESHLMFAGRMRYLWKLAQASHDVWNYCAWWVSKSKVDAVQYGVLERCTSLRAPYYITIVLLGIWCSDRLCKS